MLPKYHIIIGFLFSIIVWLILPQIGVLGFLLIFLSSILIDIDHYLTYGFQANVWDLRKSYIKHKEIFRKRQKPIMHLLHSVEFLILVFLLSLLFHPVVFILIGLLFHSITDMIDMAIKRNFNAREYFLIKYLISDKSKYLNLNTQ